MPLHQIQSLDDARLDPYRSLKSTNETRWTNRFVVEGDKLVERLLASRFHVHSVLVAHRFAEGIIAAAPRDADVLVVDDAWVQEIVGFNFHRGILACADRGPRLELAALLAAAGETVTLVICPDVQDPENLGSIIRTATALGIDGIVLGSDCCDPFSRRVLRVSMGASLELPIAECSNLAAQLASPCIDPPLTLWATVTDQDAEPLSGLVRPPRVALVLGSEGHGLSAEWIGRCHRRVTIPMRGPVDSLNVAVAAGIALDQLMSLAIDTSPPRASDA